MSLIYAMGMAQANDLFFSTLTVRDGLPSNIISSVCQDKHGFIWVGTGSGLARFDGYEFKVFKKTESDNSLPSNELNVVVSDDQTIWVGTWDGLARVDIETFAIERIDIGISKAVRALCVGKNGNLWIGTNNGLIRLNPTTGKYRIYDQGNSDLSHNTVRTIYEDDNQNLWVGTYDGLNKLAPGKRIFETIAIESAPESDNHLILDIQPEPLGGLWIGSETGLYQYDLATETTRSAGPKNGFSNEVIKCIYPGPDGVLWLGTDFGLNIFSPKTLRNTGHFHHPNIPYSLANNVVWQVFEDKGGVLWLVTSNGLCRYNRQGNFYQFHDISYQINDQIIGNQVKSFLVDRKGKYWLATQNGVVYVDPATQRKTIFRRDSKKGRATLSNNIYALEEDTNGKIWIGSSGGINIWDPNVGRMQQIRADEKKNGLNSNYIGKFSKQEDGTLWVSAWQGGIFNIDVSSDGDVRFLPIAGMESGSELHTYGDGRLWVIDNDQLYAIDTATLIPTKVESFQNGTEHQMIYSLFYSKSGYLWAGTVNGLLRYDPKTDTTTYHEIKSSSDIIISSIIEDEDGNIWSTTNASLYKYYLDKGQFEVFPLDKNLPISSFYYGCATRDPKGEIFFGGDNGYIQFDPADARPNTYSPPVYFTSLEINNEAIGIDLTEQGGLINTDIAFTKKLTLPYENRSFTLQFAALHYWQPESNIYSYKLEGFDEGWKHVSGLRNFAIYSNMPSGDYRLIVKGSNNYGIESSETASLQITVKPPLFLSPGFIALYAVLLIAGIFYSLRTYSARVHLKNELKIAKLEKEHSEEIERTKERFFTNISHELRTPISLILPPIHEIQKKGKMDEFSRHLISLAEKNSVRLLRLVNQILDFNKIETDVLQLKVSEVEMVGFCREIFGLFEDRAKRNEIDFVWDSESEQQDVWVDAEKLETVLFNLLSNAFKFTSSGGRIEVRLGTLAGTSDFEEGAFQIVVKDSGVGIPKEDQSRIFERFYQAQDGRKKESGSGIGLTLAAEYVELHHGLIQLDSEVGQGTEFTVSLPLGKSHLPVDSIEKDAQIKLLAKPSLHGPQEGSKFYQLDLESDKPLVLLIDDNQDMIEFVRSSLGHKYNFVLAQDGQEGLRKANNFSPEIIVSDIMMPNMDGIELCKKIKGNPKTTHISIIFISAKSMTENRVAGMRVGADAYIVKPFEIELLEAQIDTLIQRQKELMEYFRNDLIRMPAPPDASNNEDNKFVKKVMDLIEANISNSELTVEMIASEMAMSSTHLYRRLKATTDHSAKEIIQKYRLKKASQLLQNKEGNITEVMYRVGFTSLSYFSKCFKAEYDISPKQYQEKLNR